MLARADHIVPVLLFYVCVPSVIIGKNQNPWRECDVSQLTEKNIRLARRVSGGGAVYHDPGNLNYSLITSRNTYSPQRNFKAIRCALGQLGVSASVNERNAIFVDDQKISGTAFCLKKECAMQHGTLLFDANLANLACVLQSSMADLQTHAVSSHPDPVMNLVEYNDSLTMTKIEEALINAFVDEYHLDPEPLPESMLSEGIIPELKKKHASTDWIYNATPPFEVGLIIDHQDCVVHVEKGVVQEVRGEGVDASRWVGREFRSLYENSHLSP